MESCCIHSFASCLHCFGDSSLFFRVSFSLLYSTPLHEYTMIYISILVILLFPLLSSFLLLFFLSLPSLLSSSPPVLPPCLSVSHCSVCYICSYHTHTYLIPAPPSYQGTGCSLWVSPSPTQFLEYMAPATGRFPQT